MRGQGGRVLEIYDQKDSVRDALQIFHEDASPTLRSVEFASDGIDILLRVGFVMFGSQEYLDNIKGNFCMLHGLKKKECKGKVGARGKMLANGRWEIKLLTVEGLQYFLLRGTPSMPKRSLGL